MRSRAGAHAWARFAFSRESRVSPKPSSTASRATSTSSPTATVNAPLSSRNWPAGMAESDFRPALTITKSGPISTTRPVRREPGRICCPARLSSSMSAKLISNSLMCPRLLFVGGSRHPVIRSPPTAIPARWSEHVQSRARAPPPPRCGWYRGATRPRQAEAAPPRAIDPARRVPGLPGKGPRG